MKKLLFITLFVLTGCAGPVVTSFSDKYLTLEHDPSIHSFEIVQAKADSLCLEHFNKKATHVLTDPKSKFYVQHSTFHCE